MSVDQAASGSGHRAEIEIWDDAVDEADEGEIVIGQVFGERQAFMIVDGEVVDLGPAPDMFGRAVMATASFLSLHPKKVSESTAKMTEDPQNPWRVDVTEGEDMCRDFRISHAGTELARFSRTASGMMIRAKVARGLEASAAKVMSRLSVRVAEMLEEEAKRLASERVSEGPDGF